MRRPIHRQEVQTFIFNESYSPKKSVFFSYIKIKMVQCVSAFVKTHVLYGVIFYISTNATLPIQLTVPARKNLPEMIPRLV